MAGKVSNTMSLAEFRALTGQAPRETPVKRAKGAGIGKPSPAPAKPRKTARKGPKTAEVDLFVEFARAEGLAVAREYEFHPQRRWRFDYALPRERIALEVEGGVWQYGRHNRAAGFLGDMDKYNAAAVLGWRVLRVTPKNLRRAATLEMIRAAINGGTA